MVSNLVNRQLKQEMKRLTDLYWFGSVGFLGPFVFLGLYFACFHQKNFLMCIYVLPLLEPNSQTFKLECKYSRLKF